MYPDLSTLRLMYYPTHRPQLTGIATAGVDCGVRATQMGLAWLSKGKVILSVKQIRAVMKDQDQTNYADWDRVIDALGGRTLGFSGEKTNDAAHAREHMEDGGASGGAVIWAVDYGKLRRAMPAKTGSLTFNGYHAILTVGSRDTKRKPPEWRDFDSLLDGRYRGCPNGPVWAPRGKILDAAKEVGRKEVGRPDVYAVLLHRDPTLAGIEAGDLIPDGGGITLGDIVSDLHEVQGVSPDPDLAQVIDDLEAVIGITGNPEADEDTPVESGIAIAA